MKRVICLAVAAAGAVLTVAGCQSSRTVATGRPATVASATVSATPTAPDGVAAPTATQPVPVASSPPATAGPTGTARPPAPGATGPVGASPGGGTQQPACSQDTLRSSIQTLATDFASGVKQVKVYNCVDGFARLFATGVGSQPAGDQFFLQYSAGRWQLLARGAAIDCGDNNPKLVQACAAFDAQVSH